MSSIIEALREEHANMRILLELIEREFQHAEKPDFGLLHEIMTYCLTYPDQYHHPKEDLIYRAICDHDPQVTPAIGDLEAEHEEIGIATRELADLVETAHAKPEDPPPGMKEVALAFVAQYRDHITREDGEFFPSALQILGPEEWAAVNDEISHPGDPLYYETANDRLQTLLRREMGRGS